MLKAISRWFSAVIAIFNGKVDSASEKLRSDPSAIKAEYTKVIEEKKNRLNTYKEAVGKIIAQKTQKMERLKTLTEEIEKFRKLESGAKAKAQKVASGRIKSEVEADPEYLRCRQAFADFSSTRNEKESHAEELDVDIKSLDERVADHKRNMETLVRELDKIKVEQHDAVAEIISAKEEQAIADTLSGISDDESANSLNNLREIRRNVKGQAEIAKQLSGLDNAKNEAEFLAEMQNSEANSEFDDFIEFKEEPIDIDGIDLLSEPYVSTESEAKAEKKEEKKVRQRSL